MCAANAFAGQNCLGKMSAAILRPWQPGGNGIEIAFVLAAFMK